MRSAHEKDASPCSIVVMCMRLPAVVHKRRGVADGVATCLNGLGHTGEQRTAEGAPYLAPCTGP